MTMEQKCFYLVTTLIEFSDSVSDGHALYASLDDAKRAMAKEVADAAENFNLSHGEYVLDLPYIREWRDADGGGFTIGIEEMAVL